MEEGKKNFPTAKLAGKQILAARGLAGLKQAELAEAADVSEMTINNIETGKVRPHLKTLERIREVLEARGIEFTNGDGIGVRLRFRAGEDSVNSAT